MSNEYRHNHYVPQWYQRRFTAAHAKDNLLYYLDGNPAQYVDKTGVTRQRKSVTRQHPRSSFAERDLYTTRFGTVDSVDIERYFFGEIDNEGAHAIEYFANFLHPAIGNKHLHALLRYMTTQKLRTPKGLAWLLSSTPARSKNDVLKFMQHLEFVYAAIWCECVWQIADAAESRTKFIVSDHPVTVFNSECAPESTLAGGIDDPDIRQNGSHTIFPLSRDKILILTNLSWARNPYQAPLVFRPNPAFSRSAIFNWQHIQTLRHLTESEVIQINYIIKQRAFRFIAASEEEWLFPEKYVDVSDWRALGDGFLLMPDPRSMTLGGKVIFGGGPGPSRAWDEYGHRPGDISFDDRNRQDAEWETFHRFKGEFARRFGPQRRGRAMSGVHVDPERDSDDLHQANLQYETEYHRFTRIN